jgi:hypothetical protein
MRRLCGSGRSGLPRWYPPRPIAGPSDSGINFLDNLLQFHEIIRMSDPDRVFAPGGAIETVPAARDAGKIRYIGFTGHKSPTST